MKNIFIIGLFVLSLSGCRTQKISLETIHQKPVQTPLKKSDMIKIVQIDLLKDTVFEVRKDGIGKIYPVFQKAEGTAVLKLEVGYDLKIPVPDSRQNYVLFIPLPNPLKVDKKEGYKVPLSQILFGFQAFNPQAGYRFLTEKDGQVIIKAKDKSHLIVQVELKGKPSKMNGSYIIELSDTSQKK
jgi:hypothetical protein